MKEKLERILGVTSTELLIGAVVLVGLAVPLAGLLRGTAGRASTTKNDVLQRAGSALTCRDGSKVEFSDGDGGLRVSYSESGPGRPRRTDLKCEGQSAVAHVTASSGAMFRISGRDVAVSEGGATFVVAMTASASACVAELGIESGSVRVASVVLKGGDRTRLVGSDSRGPVR